jgi:hypothetical protein
MSDLIARAKKALEIPDRAKNAITLREHARTSKLMEALLEIVETASLTDFEEVRRCEKILERALDETEKE